MQDDFDAVGNVISQTRVGRPIEIDVVTVRQFLGYTRGQLLPLQPLGGDRGACSHDKVPFSMLLAAARPAANGTTRDT